VNTGNPKILIATLERDRAVACLVFALAIAFAIAFAVSGPELQTDNARRAINDHKKIVCALSVALKDNSNELLRTQATLRALQSSDSK
jgi:hypothetical protein